MPAAISLEQELQNLGMAAQQGVVTQTEALNAAQELIAQSSQTAQTPPAIPRALDPRVDAVINQPDKGAHPFDEAIGEGIKGAVGAGAAKWGLENILPTVMTNHARDPEVVKNLRQTVMDVDVKQYNQAEGKILNEVKGYIGRASRGTHAKAHEILEKIELSSLNNLHSNTAIHDDIVDAINHKMRVEVTPGAKKLLGAAVAVVALGAAYRGFEDAQQAKKDKLELKQTAAGIQEDYAGLHNESGKLRDALEKNYNEAAYERELRSQMERQFNALPVPPATLVHEPVAQGQGLAFVPPSISATRAEIQEYQRKMDAVNAASQTQM